MAQTNNDILSPALLQEPLPDKQNVPFVQKIFSEQVETQLTNLGHDNEALLVKNVRNWYNAYNERGISVETRIE